MPTPAERLAALERWRTDADDEIEDARDRVSQLEEALTVERRERRRLQIRLRRLERHLGRRQLPADREHGRAIPAQEALSPAALEAIDWLTKDRAKGAA